MKQCLNNIMTKSKKQWSIIDILHWGTSYFREKDIDSPRLTIELLLCAAVGLRRIDLYLQHDKPLAENELQKLREMVKRRLRREPLQYILGETEFYGLQFFVNRSVLIPRPESELIVEKVTELVGQGSEATTKILDIGTGSGCLAIALAGQISGAQVVAVDISNAALTLAKQNAQLHNIDTIRFVQCDVLQSLPPDGPFDIVVTNPPYIAQKDIAELQPEVRKYEPHSALTDNADGLEFYRRFAAIFPQILKDDGVFCVEIGADMEERIVPLFEGVGFQTSSWTDLAGIPRVMIGRPREIRPRGPVESASR